MSLLAGYDVLIELGRELMRDLVIANLKWSGIGAAPPFELAMPISAGHDAPTGFYRLTIRDVRVDLQTARPISIHLVFDAASAILPSTGLHSLDGRIDIPVYFPDVFVKNGEAHISLDLSAIEPWGITFSPAARERARAQLGSDELCCERILEAWRETLADFIQKQNLLLIPTGLTVTSSEGGLLPLRFYVIEAHGIGAAGKSQQALGLFGTLLIAHSYDGTPSFKITSALPAGMQLALSISPDVFLRFIFDDSLCEATNEPVANSLKLEDEERCESISRQSTLALSSIEAKFEDGFLAISGVLDTDFGTMDFWSEVILTVENSRVITAVKTLNVWVPGAATDTVSEEVAEFRLVIGHMLDVISRKMTKRLTECVRPTLLWRRFDHVHIVKDQGLTFSGK